MIRALFLVAMGSLILTPVSAQQWTLEQLAFADQDRIGVTLVDRNPTHLWHPVSEGASVSGNTSLKACDPPFRCASTKVAIGSPLAGITAVPAPRLSAEGGGLIVIVVAVVAVVVWTTMVDGGRA